MHTMLFAACYNLFSDHVVATSSPRCHHAVTTSRYQGTVCKDCTLNFHLEFVGFFKEPIQENTAADFRLQLR